jgi:pimeloyl-ACP methyl ester carboxylesterase
MKKTILLSFLFAAIISSTFAQKSPITPRPMSGNTSGNTKQFEHTEGQFQSINGVNIYFEQYGEGTPVLLIHDNNGSVKSFDQQINFLSKKNRVIVADSRGQGSSTLNKDSLTYEQMADDYFMLLQKLELDSVNIVGWGDGGVVALLLAINYPEKVNRIVIGGTAIVADTTAFTDAYMAKCNDAIRAAKDSIKEGVLEYRNILRVLNLRANRLYLDPELFVNIQAPVLLISGDKDDIKLEHTVALYRALPNAQLSIIPNSTNAVYRETPMVVNNLINKFFAKNNGNKPGINKAEKQGGGDE